ncbi:MMPL family transporter [Nocardia thailandica]|uniref:MMPL family transporter n=1 Tax=Nocardia thailandica TaxID=257275 RepID=UPI0002E9C29E|nr:efflux RND transporter permease subunit [Nocardia thailandica]
MTATPVRDPRATTGPDAPARPNLLGRWGLLMARRRRLVFTVWGLILLAGALAQPQLEQRLRAPDLTVDGSESRVAAALVADRFPALGAEQNVIVFDAATLTAEDPAYRAVVTDALDRARATAGVRVLLSPYDRPDRQISADHRAAYALIGLDGDMPHRSETAKTLQSALGTASTPQVRAALTGDSAVINDIIAVEKADTTRAEAIGIPVAFALLAVALGALAAALVPVGTALAAILLCVTVLFGLSLVTSVNPLMLSMATMIGTGVGIDYALIVVSRFREALHRERHAGTSTEDAVAAAVGESAGTAGRTVLASGVIVVIAMCSLALVPVGVFRGVAVSVSAAVLGTLLVATTLLPAVLAALGHRIDRGGLPAWLTVPEGADPAHSRWARWARWVMRRPVLLGVLTVAALAALAWPVTGIRYGNDIGVSQIPGTPSGHAAAVLTDEFGPGLLSPIQVVVGAEPGAGARTGPAVDRLVGEFTGDARVSAIDRIPGRDAVLVSVVPSVPVDSPDSAALVADLRRSAHTVADRVDGGDVTVAVGGTTASFAELTDTITARMPWVIGAVLACSLLLLVAMLRSLALPVKAIAMNVLATGAALGITVAIFQWGWGEQLLGFTSRGFLQSFLPLTVFVILFGLSMDYEVFLIHRIREYWTASATRDDHANTESVAAGTAHTARYITAAAAIMIVVFGSFVTARVTEIKQIGLTLAVAVALDAFVIRLLLVPAFMKLLGRWNWWLPTRRP